MMCSIDMWFSDSSSDESEDEEDLVRIRRERKRIRDNSNPLEMDAEKFLESFRLTKEVFSDLLTEIDDKLKGIRSTSIPNILKLAVTLKFCAHGAYQVHIDKEGSFGLAQPTVSSIFTDVLNALEQTICPQYIDFHYSETEVEEAKLYFKKLCGIPGVIGCIDVLDVVITTPEKKLQPLYHNKEGYSSIKALIVCDHAMVIRFVSSKHAGSLKPAEVFEQSNLKPLLEGRYQNDAQSSWWLGRAAFGLHPYLMTSYRRPKKNSIQNYYNKMHGKAMNTMKSTIKILKGRFKCLNGDKALHYTPEKSAQIFNVCVALHNICCAFNIQFPLEEVHNSDKEDADDNEALDEVKDCIEAENIRREIEKALLVNK